MDALRIASTISTTNPLLIRTNLSTLSLFTLKVSRSPLPKLITQFPKSKFTPFSANTSSLSIEEETKTLVEDDKFDWFSHWYPVMPVCDLDKRAPVGKKVLGLDVVVWWDKKENAWKVFDDKCPHRLAPLSEGRIDQWGRLQCSYHGWCFGGSGDCKFIPQAPPDGPPVHTFSKACVGVYPSTVQNGIVWFWPNTDPRYKDIITEKKPPYVPEIDDPSFTGENMYNRDIPYGTDKRDREGGSPIDIINTTRIDKHGFTSIELPARKWDFMPPCLVLGTTTFKESLDDTEENLRKKPPRKALFIFFTIPVSPGKSRLITVGLRNFSVSTDLFPQRWMHHILTNIIIDSDMYFLRIQEENIMEAGPSNWQNVCFVPTKADVLVVTFRKWLKKYAGGQIDWGTKFNGHLPPIPSKEQLMDRYWSHVVNCTSCNSAYKGFKALQLSLQVFSVTLLALIAATKQPSPTRNALIVVSVMCFVGSKWLSHYIYKYFHFHDYNHAFK